MRVPEGSDRDFVAGAFVVRDGEILFLKHKRYGIWLQPGGHIEERETPDEAAKREVREETGLEVEIVDAGDQEDIGIIDGEEAYSLPEPINVNVHKVEEGHWHCDSLYIARVKGEVGDYEYDDTEIRWFSREELESGEYNMPENARRPALKVLEKI